MNQQKLVSVVIPCRNEAPSIKDCVLSILESDYEPLEVIVADGMSDDGTRGILEKLSSEFENVSFVDNPEKLTPYAFNAGVKKANGDYVQIVGSRNKLAKNYISLLVNKLEENPEIACVGGDYQHVYSSPLGKYISLAMESPFGVGASNYRTKKESCFVDTVGIPMYRKSIFDEIGYFDNRLTRNQDDDFNFRVTQKGYKIFYIFEAKTLYTVRSNFKKLFKQMNQYGYFKVFVNKKHKVLTTLRQVVPALFVLFLGLGLIGSLFSSILFKFYFLGLVTYLIAGLANSIKFTKNPYEITLIFSACFVMHLGYGLGYLKGILDFIIFDRTPSSNMERQTT